jgi:predicted component of viral defense system (DUF524 family)
MTKIIHHKTNDFSMKVSCSKITDRYLAASRRIVDIATATQYRTTGLGGQFFLWSPDAKDPVPIEEEHAARPVFFENTKYDIEIEFEPGISRNRIYSELRSVSERFVSHKRGAKQTLSGWLNFGNDIGLCDLILEYEKDRQQQRWAFHFEVFPTKLDRRTDHQLLVREIEAEYFGLSLDLLKRTYMNFQTSSGEGNDLTWWSVFDGIFHNLLSSFRFILNNPHRRLISGEEWLSAERLKKLTPALEEEVFRHKDDPGRRYKVIDKSLSSDTTENRFLKYVAGYAHEKFGIIRKYIEKTRKEDISIAHLDHMEEIERRLKNVHTHPFFKSVGKFAGIRQESAVLQKKAGYSSVYSNWIILRRSVQLFEGALSINLKDIADLYQYWCFMKLKAILQSLLESKPESTDLATVKKENFLFTLKGGNKSPGVVFTGKTGDKIELYHEFPFGRDADTIYSNRVFTEIQQPDITLRITKNDLPDPHVFTYLFDAKYKIDADRVKKDCDAPPVDAISQMHRYRDAIYHVDQKGARTRAVMGGYILFPGSDPAKAVEECGYFTSIAAIDIGGFPLLPGDRKGNGSLLEEHLREILFSDSHTLLKKAIPHKGLQYVDTDGVVLVIAQPPPTSDQGEYLLPDGSMVYLLPLLDGTNKPHAFDFSRKISYLAPIMDNAIPYYFHVTAITINQRGDLCPPLIPIAGDEAMANNHNQPYVVLHLLGKTAFAPAMETIPPKGAIGYHLLSQLKSNLREASDPLTSSGHMPIV